jgi:hypothetical protein
MRARPDEASPRGTRRWLAALGTALALLLSLLVAASASGFGPNALPPPHGLATDCTTGFTLAPRSQHQVDWVIWCGSERGRFEIQLHPQKEVGPIALVDGPNLRGPGAGVAPRCRRVEGEVFCKVRKSGPVTIRGSFTVPGDPCEEHVAVWIKSGRWSGEGIGGAPWGCPHRRAPKPPTVGQIVRFHENEHLVGAHQTRAAVLAEARRLRQAWIAEDPTARWSAGAWGVPLAGRDVKELQLRIESLGQADRLIHDWLKKTGLASIYAGWTWGPEGTIYVGFTEEPEATLARLQKAEPFLAPGRLQPFPVLPTHSEGELNKLIDRLLDLAIALEEGESEGGETYEFTEFGLDTLANKVRVGAIQAAAARRWVTEKFGAEAPIEVVKGEFGEPL